MRPILILIATVALAASMMSGTAATAKPLDKGQFTDSGTDLYDCNGIPAQETFDVRVNYLVNKRGSSPFPYFRESVSGTVVTTNLDTGGTLTYRFSVNSKDQSIVDNGDGTITVTVLSTGGARYYDDEGNFVLKDPGQTRFAFTIDYNGTPLDPEDDVEVEDSFEIVRPSTGNSDLSDVDFCDLLAQYTS